MLRTWALWLPFPVVCWAARKMEHVTIDGYPAWHISRRWIIVDKSGARTDSEPVAKGNHAQTDFATPPDDPDMREEEVWDFEAARGATNEADRVCFDAAVAWSKSRKPHCSARYRIDMREAFRAGARWAKHREVTVRNRDGHHSGDDRGARP